jgi:hypothetical protein
MVVKVTRYISENGAANKVDDDPGEKEDDDERKRMAPDFVKTNVLHGRGDRFVEKKRRKPAPDPAYKVEGAENETAPPPEGRTGQDDQYEEDIYPIQAHTIRMLEAVSEYCTVPFYRLDYD